MPLKSGAQSFGYSLHQPLGPTHSEDPRVMVMPRVHSVRKGNGVLLNPTNAYGSVRPSPRRASAAAISSSATARAFRFSPRSRHSSPRATQTAGSRSTRSTWWKCCTRCGRHSLRIPGGLAWERLAVNGIPRLCSIEGF